MLRKLMCTLLLLGMVGALTGCFTLPATPTGTYVRGAGTVVKKHDLSPGTQVSFRHRKSPNDLHVRIVSKQLGDQGFETTDGEVIRFDQVTQIEFFKLNTNAEMRIESAKESALLPVVFVCMMVGGCPIQ